MFQNICLSMYIYIYICIYFLMLCERMNKSRARLRSREIRGSYSSVKAAAGRQLCSEKVCSVSERLQERSIVSLSLSPLLFCSLSLSRLNCFTKLAHLNIFLIFFFFFYCPPFTRIHVSRKKPFMVLAEDFTMSRTDEVHRLTENVYKVRLNSWIKFSDTVIPAVGNVKHTLEGTGQDAFKDLWAFFLNFLFDNLSRERRGGSGSVFNHLFIEQNVHSSTSTFIFDNYGNTSHIKKPLQCWQKNQSRSLSLFLHGGLNYSPPTRADSSVEMFLQPGLFAELGTFLKWVCDGPEEAGLICCNR